MILSKGLIQVYTGNGKGKTTAACGLALRACGRGVPVFLVQFMKNKDSGEFIMFENIEGIKIYAFGTEDFVDKEHLRDIDFICAEKAMNKSFEILRNNPGSLIILDEINNAMDFELIKTSEVLKLIFEKPDNTELVLTGRNAPQEILEKADLITEMKEIKHPWSRNISARKGIEW